MRNSSEATLQYRISRVPVFCHLKSRECVRASIANDLHAVGHDDSAEAVLQKGKILVWSLGEAEKWLERHMGRFILCKGPTFDIGEHAKVVGREEIRRLSCSPEGLG